MLSIRPTTVLLVALAVAASVPSRVAAVPQTAATSSRLKVLVIHGPNLNLLGRREPQIYGTTTLDQINARLAELAKEINVELSSMQSNSEAAIVDAFQQHIDDVEGGVVVALVLLALGTLSSAQEPQERSGQPPAPQPGGRGRGGQATPARVRKALLAWADTRNGQAQHASTSHALAVIERLGYESGLWDTYIRTDSHIIFNQAQKTDGTPASGGPSLSNVDGIFFLGHRDVPITDQQKAELLAFVRGGKGFVAAHTGLTAFESWPEFGEMLGATYGGHLYTGPGRMINEQPAQSHRQALEQHRPVQRRVLQGQLPLSREG
jgi:hypothetical protein